MSTWSGHRMYSYCVIQYSDCICGVPLNEMNIWMGRVRKRDQGTHHQISLKCLQNKVTESDACLASGAAIRSFPCIWIHTKTRTLLRSLPAIPGTKATTWVPLDLQLVNCRSWDLSASTPFEFIPYNTHAHMCIHILTHTFLYLWKILNNSGLETRWWRSTGTGTQTHKSPECWIDTMSQRESFVENSLGSMVTKSISTNTGLGAWEQFLIIYRI